MCSSPHHWSGHWSQHLLPWGSFYKQLSPSFGFFTCFPLRGWHYFSVLEQYLTIAFYVLTKCRPISLMKRLPSTWESSFLRGYFPQAHRDSTSGVPWVPIKISHHNHTYSGWYPTSLSHLPAKAPVTHLINKFMWINTWSSDNKQTLWFHKKTHKILVFQTLYILIFSSV